MYVCPFSFTSLVATTPLAPTILIVLHGIVVALLIRHSSGRHHVHPPRAEDDQVLEGAACHLRVLEPHRGAH